MATCPNCGRDTTAAGVYCPWCSAPLEPWAKDAESANAQEVQKSASYVTDSGTILQISRELSARLGLAEFKTEHVIWGEKYRKRFALPDQPSFLGDALLLSSKLRAKLDRNEWTALLAASLIYDNKLRLARRLGRAGIISGIIVALGATIWIGQVIGSILYPAQSCQSQYCSYAAGKVLGPIDLFLFIVALYVVVAATAPYMRHLRFEADRLTARELGLKDSLLQALGRIDTLGVEPSFAHVTRIAHNPLPADRMRKLSKFSNT